MKRLCLIIAYLFLFSQTAFAMPLLIGQKVVYRGTITDLRISAVDGTAFIDNLSGTLALANSPLLHTGALTKENTRISAAATFAFIDTNDATFATNLAAHLGKYLVIKDSAGKKAYAWIKAAGTGETLGADLLSGWDLTSGWSVTNATIIDSNSFSTSPHGGVSKNIFAVQKLYYCTYIRTGTSDTMLTTGAGTSQTIIPVGSNSGYFMITNSLSIMLRNNAAGTTDITSMSAQQVLTPSTSGATIVSTKGGGVYNFSYKNASFKYNASSYYVIIRAIR